MRAICNIHTVFVVIVWSVFGQSVTNDVDQLKKDIAEAKQQLQLLNDELANMTTTVEQKDATCNQRIDRIESQIGNASTVHRCRVCFKETEGSDQCQGNRHSCSGWSNEISPNWTLPFRDDTDNRWGGCVYQWYLDCD